MLPTVYHIFIEPNSDITTQTSDALYSCQFGNLYWDFVSSEEEATTETLRPFEKSELRSQ